MVGVVIIIIVVAGNFNDFNGFLSRNAMLMQLLYLFDCLVNLCKRKIDWRQYVIKQNMGNSKKSAHIRRIHRSTDSDWVVHVNNQKTREQRIKTKNRMCKHLIIERTRKL